MGLFQNFINFFHRGKGIVKTTNQAYKAVNLQDARRISEQRAKRASLKVFNQIVENATTADDVLEAYADLVLDASGAGFFSESEIKKEATGIVKVQLKAQALFQKEQDRASQVQACGAKNMLEASDGIDLDGDEIESGTEIIANPARMFTPVSRQEKAELIEAKRQKLESRMIATKRAHFVMSTIDKFIEKITVKSKTKMNRQDKELFNKKIQAFVEKIKIQLAEDRVSHPDITIDGQGGEISTMLYNLVQARDVSDNHSVGSKYVGLKAKLTDKADVAIMEKLIDARPQVFIEKLDEIIAEEKVALNECKLSELVDEIGLYNSNVENIKAEINERKEDIEATKQAKAIEKKAEDKVKLTQEAMDAVDKADVTTFIDTNMPAFYFRDGVWNGITLTNEADSKGKRDKKYRKQLAQSKLVITKAVQEAMEFTEEEKLALAQKLVAAYKKGKNLDETILQEVPTLNYQDLCNRLIQRKDFNGEPEYYYINPLTETVAGKGKKAKAITNVITEGKLITANQFKLMEEYYSSLPESQDKPFGELDDVAMHKLYDAVSNEASTYPAGKNNHKKYASFSSDEAIIAYARQAIEKNDMATEVRKLDLRACAKDFIASELENATNQHTEAVQIHNKAQQMLAQTIDDINVEITALNNLGNTINEHKQFILNRTEKENEDLGSDTKRKLATVIKPLNEVAEFNADPTTVEEQDLDNVPISLTDKELQAISDFAITDRNIEVDVTGRPSKAGINTIKRHATTTFPAKAIAVADNMTDVIKDVLALIETDTKSISTKATKTAKVKQTSVKAKTNSSDNKKSQKPAETTKPKTSKTNKASTKKSERHTNSATTPIEEEPQA